MNYILGIAETEEIPKIFNLYREYTEKDVRFFRENSQKKF